MAKDGARADRRTTDAMLGQEPSWSARWLDRTLVAAQHPLVVAGSMVSFFLICLTTIVLFPMQHNGQFATYYQSVAHGRAAAPYQYRVLVPLLVAAVTHFAPGQGPHVVAAVDAVALFATVGLLAGAARRSGRTLEVLPLVTLYLVYWSLGALIFTSPETFVAAALVAAIVYVLPRRSPADHLVFCTCAGLLLFARPELVGLLGLVVIGRYVLQRDRLDAVYAVGLIAAALAVSEVLMLVYPHAHYARNAPVVELGYNVRTWHTIWPVLLILPLLAPLIRRWRTRDESWLDEATVIMWAALFAAATLVVARPEEVRLYIPFAGVLALVAAPREAEERIPSICEST